MDPTCFMRFMQLYKKLIFINSISYISIKIEFLWS